MFAISIFLSLMRTETKLEILVDSIYIAILRVMGDSVFAAGTPRTLDLHALHHQILETKKRVQLNVTQRAQCTDEAQSAR